MILLMLLAALLWGVTNPLLKHYSRGMPSRGSAKDDTLFLLRRPKYLVTQAVNLSGSVVFFYSLREVDVSVGSIVVNSLAFVITVLMSVFVLREGLLCPQTATGCLLVMVGTALCTYSSGAS
ncbi:putative transmembrane family 234 [Leishmania utingensis]|uniref:Transmembrane family 234 n=1 Tax=Leishmania utingensis TaxID=653362 RepID=A0AAW3AFJ9_9TRYP